MNETVGVLTEWAGRSGSLVAVIAASITLAVVTVATTLPKILNSMRSDRLEGNVLVRVQNLEVKSVAQDAKIHRYAVRVTRLTVLTMRLHALLVDHKVCIPQDIVDEIIELTKETEEDTP